MARTLVTVRRPAQPVTMRRAFVPPTSDQALWVVIRNSASALEFHDYASFIDPILCGTPGPAAAADMKTFSDRRNLPFPDVDPYRLLKVATEVFMMWRCGVVTDAISPFARSTSLAATRFQGLDLNDESLRLQRAVTATSIDALWRDYLVSVNGRETIPYLEVIRAKLGDVPLRGQVGGQDRIGISCYSLLRQKLTKPCLLELIWNYWHEEGMLVQSMNAISWRFQNRHAPTGQDPLAMVEIDPLRPLNNLLWGWVQDEQHRLTIPRRTYEYDHEYGLKLLGKAVPDVRGADTRSKFLEGFHNLLQLCSIFYKEDDDTTVVADGFPVLNALREVHLLLTQGAHNQYGDLPWTARQEFLMMEWLIARPEMREFLPGRVMVDYPEPWMDRVETMKTLQRWTDSSILHFRDLGIFGEKILLGIRYGRWTDVIEPEQAANWTRYWRPEIQGYIHAYRVVTGVDLTERVDATLPSVLLLQRLPKRAPAPLPGRAARALPRPAPVVQVPVPSELQEWGGPGP